MFVTYGTDYLSTDLKEEQIVAGDTLHVRSNKGVYLTVISKDTDGSDPGLFTLSASQVDSISGDISDDEVMINNDD